MIGDAAKNQVARNPENTASSLRSEVFSGNPFSPCAAVVPCCLASRAEVFDAKRLIGRKFQDPIVQSDIKLWPFKCVAGPGDKPLIVVQVEGEDSFKAQG